MTKNKLLLLWIFMAILSVQYANAQDISKFDTNNSKDFSDAEIHQYILKTRYKEVLKADTNGDGIVSAAEIALLSAAFPLDFINRYHHAAPYTYREVVGLYPVPATFKTAGILLRETAEDISPYASAAAISKIKAATFSFTHDFGAGTNTWIAKGAIMRPWKVKQNFFIAPSITFNRVISEDATKGANSLIPKFGLYLSPDGRGLFFSHLIRLFGNYGTDFDFKSSQYGVEVEWEPVFKNGPFGVYWRPHPDSKVELRLQAFLHAEAGYVKDKGEKENLKSDDTYLRAGGKLGVDFRFFEAVELSTGYRYLKGFSGTPKDSRYFTGALAYSLGPNGNIALKIEYQKGNLPLTQEEVDNVVLGLGIKF